MKNKKKMNYICKMQPFLYLSNTWNSIHHVQRHSRNTCAYTFAMEKAIQTIRCIDTGVLAGASFTEVLLFSIRTCLISASKSISIRMTTVFLCFLKDRWRRFIYYTRWTPRLLLEHLCGCFIILIQYEILVLKLTEVIKSTLSYIISDMLV